MRPWQNTINKMNLSYIENLQRGREKNCKASFQNKLSTKSPYFSIHFSPNPTAHNHMPSKKALMPIEFFPHFTILLILLDGGSNVGVVGQQFAHRSK